MRRLFAVVLALAAVVLVAPAAAVAGTAPITVRGASAVQSGWTTPVQVSIASVSPVTSIAVTLYSWHVATPSTPYATLSDFQLTSGTSTDGVWTSTSSVRLTPGSNPVYVAATDAANDHVGPVYAGAITNAVPVTFSAFTVTPQNLTVDHQLSYSGRIVYTDAQGVQQPLLNARVNIMSSTVANRLDLAISDANGHFSGSTRVEQSATITASLFKDPMQAVSTGVPVTVPVAHTRLLAALESQPTQTGQEVYIDVHVQRQAADGSWVPIGTNGVLHCSPGVFFESLTGCSNSSWFVADGSARVWGQTPPSGTWTISYDPGSEAFEPATVQVQVANPGTLAGLSQFSSLAASASRVAPGGTVHVTGRLLGGRTLPATTPIPNVTVYAGFTPDGSQVGGSFTGQTSASGYFDILVTVTGSGTLSVSGPNDPQYVATYGTVGHVSVFSTTSFTPLHAVPRPVRKGHLLTITGSLLTGDQGGTGTQLPGRTITLWFLAAGTHTWVTVRTTVTTARNTFTFTVHARRTGRWKVTFSGDPDYLASASPSIRVAVI